jgi:hypothetical protein
MMTGPLLCMQQDVERNDDKGKWLYTKVRESKEAKYAYQFVTGGTTASADCVVGI